MKKFSIFVLLLTGIFYSQSTFAANLSSKSLLGASVSKITTVKDVQTKLVNLGVNITPTGVVDIATINAIKNIQEKNYLKVDGIVGKDTFKILNSSLSSQVSNSALPSANGPISQLNKDLLIWNTLCSDGNPHIQVKSPNGGEVYQEGQTLKVSWRYCNIPNASQQNIDVVLRDVINSGAITLGRGQLADGEVIVSLAQGWASGLKYKMNVQWNPPYAQRIDDNSDNLFTINGINSNGNSSSLSTNWDCVDDSSFLTNNPAPTAKLVVNVLCKVSNTNNFPIYVTNGGGLKFYNRSQGQNTSVANTNIHLITSDGIKTNNTTNAYEIPANSTKLFSFVEVLNTVSGNTYVGEVYNAILSASKSPNGSTGWYNIGPVNSFFTKPKLVP